MVNRPDPDGFTLIEVLVALSVFSMAAMGLAHLIAESTRGAGYASLRVLASIEADNQLADAFLTAEALSPGVKTGTKNQLNQSLSWQRTIIATQQPSILAISVVISDPSSGQEIIRRHTLVDRTAR